MEALDQKKLSDMVNAHIGVNIYATGLFGRLTEDAQYELSASYDYEGETYEPLEYWVVNTEAMERKLTEHGEKVLWGIWCRTTSGQAIYMDAVMEEIAKEWRII
jgi:hypothetical protein